jgi:multiple sugar transport system permease protein
VRSLRGDNNNRKWIVPLVFILPSLLFILLVNIYPLFSGITYSFSNKELLGSGTFIGLKNYIDVIQSADFRNSIGFTLTFSLSGVLGSFVFGLLAALLLNCNIPARSFFRSALLLPWIVPSVVSVTCWRWMVLKDTSIINVVIQWFGGAPIYFLSDQKWAVVLVCALKIWKNFPFVAVSVLAALQGVNRNLFEAARVDGANKWQVFWNITWPHLIPVITTTSILLCIWCFNDFENLFLLTQGGPLNSTTNIVILAYNYAFTKNAIGEASAMAILQMIDV